MGQFARYISDKYNFFDVDADEETEFTKDLQNIASGIQMASLRSKDSRNIELAQTIDYMKHSSGLYNLLYKVHSLWGHQGVVKLLTHFHDEFFQEYRSGYVGSWDARNWVISHLLEYLGTNLEDYFSVDKCISKTMIPVAGPTDGGEQVQASTSC